MNRIHGFLTNHLMLTTYEWDKGGCFPAEFKAFIGMADPQQIAKMFTDFYYQTFDSNRAQLSTLYKEISMMTFEGSQVFGVAKIAEKFASLPFNQVQHKVLTIDVQPSNPNVATAMIVSVTGQLIVDPEPGKPPKPLFFSQVFQLIPEGANSFWIYNDIFRLNYG